MTTNPESAQTPRPTRNPIDIVSDLLLLGGGACVVAGTAGRLLRRTGQAGVAMSFSVTALTVFCLMLSVAMITLAALALQSNLSRVPRDGHGRPLPQRDAEGGEPGDNRE